MSESSVSLQVGMRNGVYYVLLNSFSFLLLQHFVLSLSMLYSYGLSKLCYEKYSYDIDWSFCEDFDAQQFPFILRDISTRTFLARFSSPSTSVCQFLPIALFRWQSKAHDHINDLAATRKALCLEQCENSMATPIDGEDVAIWLFLSTVCNTDVQQDFQSTDCKLNPVGFWRLALLVKNRVILGSALDSRAAAIGASAGHGNIGTGDGLVYMRELSTGTKFKDLQCFKGVGVSCITTSNSESGPLAIASGDQLRVYLHSLGGLV